MTKSLFKYLHSERTDVLANGTIRFSSPKVLNDPFELKPYISALAPSSYIQSGFDQLLPKILEEEYEKLPITIRAKVPFSDYLRFAKERLPLAKAGMAKLIDMTLPMIRGVVSQKFEELMGILCLTESPTNLLMWAHYADSHQGFVIEFDPESPFFDQRIDPDDELRHIRKVIYCDERPSVMLSEIEDFLPFLTKGNDWSYECEWRMILPLTNASQVIGSGSTGLHLFEFPKSAIRSVIFGCRMTDSKKAEIRRILYDNNEYSHIRCVETKIDEKHYRVFVTDIDS